jgi:hypothetical protein
MPDQYKDMRLSVLSQEPIFSRPNGSTLYRVEAVDEDGNQVPDLRTFAEELPHLDLTDFKLKRYDHPEHGTTWTILDPSGGPGKTTSDVEKRLHDVEQRLRKVEQRVGESDGSVHPAQRHHGDEVKGPDFFNP